MSDIRRCLISSFEYLFGFTLFPARRFFFRLLAVADRGRRSDESRFSHQLELAKSGMLTRVAIHSVSQIFGESSMTMACTLIWFVTVKADSKTINPYLCIFAWVWCECFFELISLNLLYVRQSDFALPIPIPASVPYDRIGLFEMINIEGSGFANWSSPSHSLLSMRFLTQSSIVPSTYLPDLFL